MLHQVIETLNARVALRNRYDNFIGGKSVPPVDGKYFDNISPITGKTVCQVARSQAADIELALDAGHKAKESWGKTAPAKRAEILNKIADRMEAEPRTAGRWSRPGTTASRSAKRLLPTCRWRSIISAISRACIRAEEGSRSELDHNTVGYHQGAARRRRPDHPVELSDPDGDLEARTGTRGRQLHGPNRPNKHRRASWSGRN